MDIGTKRQRLDLRLGQWKRWPSVRFVRVWWLHHIDLHGRCCDVQRWSDCIRSISFQIAISATTERGDKPWYLEECSATLASAYSSGQSNSGERDIVSDESLLPSIWIVFILDSLQRIWIISVPAITRVHQLQRLSLLQFMLSFSKQSTIPHWSFRCFEFGSISLALVPISHGVMWCISLFSVLVPMRFQRILI